MSDKVKLAPSLIVRLHRHLFFFPSLQNFDCSHQKGNFTHFTGFLIMHIQIRILPWRIYKHLSSTRRRHHHHHHHHHRRNRSHRRKNSFINSNMAPPHSAKSNITDFFKRIRRKEGKHPERCSSQPSDQHTRRMSFLRFALRTVDGGGRGGGGGGGGDRGWR